MSQPYEDDRWKIHIDSMEMYDYGEVNGWYGRNAFIGGAISRFAIGKLPDWFADYEASELEALKPILKEAYEPFMEIRREEVLIEYPNNIRSSLIILFWSDFEGTLRKSCYTYQ